MDTRTLLGYPGAKDQAPDKPESCSWTSQPPGENADQLRTCAPSYLAVTGARSTGANTDGDAASATRAARISYPESGQVHSPVTLPTAAIRSWIRHPDIQG